MIHKIGVTVTLYLVISMMMPLIWFIVYNAASGGTFLVYFILCHGKILVCNM